MGRRPVRDSRFFGGQRMVTVRCPSCRVRLAEVWPTSGAVTGRSWDGMVFCAETRGQWPEVTPTQWTCQRCAHVEAADDRTLHWQLSAAAGDRPEVVLGAGPPQQDEWWRDL